MRKPILLVLDDTDDLSIQVRRATATLRPEPEVLWWDQLESIESDVGPGTFEVVIAGPSMAGAKGLDQLRQLRARIPHMKLILAFEGRRAPSMRDTVRTGALDILRLPVEDAVLAESVAQALELGPAPADTPLEIKDANAQPGTVIVVASGTGGCGKTFLATNLAYHLQSRLGKRTCLIDLDLQFGELSTALRLKPRYTIADLVAQGSDEDLPARLEECLAHHETGIRVLGAPAEPAIADTIDPSGVAAVIEAAASSFDYVIVDTPSAITGPVLAALDQADQIFALATLDLPSVRNLGILLSTFSQLKVPAERVSLVLNKVEPDVGIDVEHMTKYFPQGFSIVVPYGREVNRSLNMGQPLLAYAPRGEVSKALGSGLSSSVLGCATVDSEPPRRGMFGRRLSRTA